VRVLFACVSEKSHILTMAPLAWALTTAGHEVRMASAPAMTDTITSAGLTAVPVGTDHSLHEALAQEESVEHPLSDWSEPWADAQTWEMLLLKYQVGVGYAFQPYNDTIVDELVEFARQWRPDLVVWDPITFAGGVAARAVGAAHTRLSWCVDVYSTMRQVFHDLAAQQPAEQRSDPMADWLGEQLERHGGGAFGEDVVNGQWTVDMVPDGIQLPLEVDRVPMRFVPYGGRAVVPDWLRVPAERRRVLLTLGVSFAKAFGGTYVPVDAALEALADLDVEVVATLSDAERDAAGTIPGNVRVVDFVPMNALMPTCAAAVHHGGFGTWTTAALHGVPQQVLPIRMSDMWIRGQRMEAFGSGLATHPSVATPEGLRANVTALLDEPEYARKATELQQVVLETPTPNGIVGRLQELAEKHRA
jgi:glycosyltransferase (activator-dependent family)